MIEDQIQIYNDREERNIFIAEILSEYVIGSVANIGGGGEKHLAKYLKNSNKYVELDICGSPDIVCDLENDLPFRMNNQEYDCVVATDVLEHIENPLEVLDEMIRVSGKFVILSLPNPWSMMKTNLLKKDGKSGKFYGFPTVSPIDRHKWFFNPVEAELFYNEYAKNNDLEIVEIFHIGYRHKNYTKNMLRYFVEIMFGKNVRKNLFSSAVWCVYRV